MRAAVLHRHPIIYAARRVRAGLGCLCAMALLWHASGCSTDLIAINPAGTGGAGGAGGNASCTGNPCVYSDPGHPAQCCDGNRCNGSVCVPWDAGACSNFRFGQSCTSDNTCCGSPCEAFAQSPNKICIGTVCKVVGSPCTTDSDCCSLSCEFGVCTNGRSCLMQSENCGSDFDCCSKNCNKNTGKCDNFGSSCAVVGDSCKSPDDCCSKTCIDVGNGSRCLGSGCGQLGEACDESGKCCSGNCAFCRCTPQCAPKGSLCGGDECCSKYCIPSANGPGTCSDYFAPGELCFQNANCSKGARCQYDQQLGNSVCVMN